MNRGSFFLLLTGLGWAAGLPGTSLAQSVDTVEIRLEDAERRALETSPLLSPARASVELAEAERSQARSARILPELNLRNVWGPAPQARGEFNEFGVLSSPDTSIGIGDLTWFTQVDAEFVQPVFTFGKIGSRIDAAEHQVELRRAELETTRADILFQVREVYWGAVLAEELRGVSESVMERVAEAEERLDELYDEGTATQNDMFKFQIFQYEVRSRAREVETGRTKALDALRSLMGLPDRVPVRLATSSLEAPEVSLLDLDTYIEAAMANRPELRQLDAGLRARQSLVDGAVADGRPSFFVAGEFSLNHSPGRFDPENPFWNNPTNFSRGGLIFGVDWNFNFWQNRNRARVERLQLRELEAQAEPLRMKLEQEVREAFLDVVRARDDVEDGREALRASENLLRAELQTFDLGLGDIEDVIGAFEANVGMTVEQMENIATFHRKLAELSRRVGRDVRQQG